MKGLKKAAGVLFVTQMLMIVISSVVAQNPDSLELVLRAVKNDDQLKLKLYFEISNIYMTQNAGKAKIWAAEGVLLAHKTGNRQMLSRLYRNLGASYGMLSDYDSAMFYLEKAKMIAVTLDEKETDALVDLSLGTVLTRQRKMEEAMAKFMEARSYFESTGDKNYTSRVFGNIAALYMYSHNFGQAEKYYLEAEKLASEVGDHSRKGQAYSGLSKINLERNNLKKALDFAEKAANEFKFSGEKAYESLAYKEMASICLSLNEPGKAEVNAAKAFTIASESGLTKYIANALAVLANVSYYKGNYLQAIQYAEESLKTDSTDVETNASLFATLLKCHVFNGDTEKAVNYFRKYQKETDLLVNDKYRQSVSEMEVRYETEKKVLQIKALEERKRVYLLAGLSLFLLMLTFVILLIYRDKNIRSKKEIAEQKIIQLEKEKQLIATRSLLAGEEIERTRLAGDLHDGLGGLLTGVKLKLSSMKENSIISSENLAHFNHALDLLDTSIAEMRRVAHNLMPETLMHYGLQTAIADFVRQVEPEGLPVIRFNSFGENLRFEKELEITVYRITQELVNNALKHANAKQIEVQLFTEKGRVSLQVVDNGTGFNPNMATGQTAGKGLKNINDRINAFNGHFEILSEPGKGTECTLEFLIS